MRKQCIVTTSWDDGHTLDIRLARLLKKYGVAGTFYVCPFDREFKKRDLLTKRQILSVSCDFEIGGHTMTHPRLTNIPLTEAGKEIQEGKLYLETVTGKPVRSFCYPGGNNNPDIQKLVREAGFRIARTVDRYAFSAGNNPFAVPTTFHTYNHFSDIHRIVAFSGFHVGKWYRYTDWEFLAIDLFDYCLKNKLLFHLFGHSWELEKYASWEKLERVLRHISLRKNVRYVPNGDIEV